MQHLAVTDLAAWLNDASRPQPLLLDVREPWEYELGHLPGALSLPMALTPLRASELPDDRDIVAICHHGMRSHQVAQWLQNNGFAPEKLWNLNGGVAAWADAVDNDFPRY